MDILSRIDPVRGSRGPATLERYARAVPRRLPVLVGRLLALSAASQPQLLTDTDVDELGEVLAQISEYLHQFGFGTPDGAAAACLVLADGAARAALLRMVAAAVRWPLTAPSSSNASRRAGSCGGSSHVGSSGGGSGDGDGGSRTGSSGSGDGGGGGGSQAGSGGSGGGGGSSSRAGSRGSGTYSVRARAPAYAGLAQEACSVAEALLQMLMHRPHASPAASDFIQALFRMQTLHALARQFAAAAGCPEALTGPQLRHAAWSARLLNAVAVVVASSAPGAEYAYLFRELAEALHGSGVMEHAPRLLLLLVLRGPPPAGCAVVATASRPLVHYDNPRSVLLNSLLAAYQNVGALYMSTKKGGGDPATCAALREVLTGRCAQHMVLAHGVAALSAADGGDTYGMPEDVRRAMYDSCDMAGTHLSRAGQPGCLQLDSGLPFALIAAVGQVGPGPSVGVRAGVSLLLRLARLAVASLAPRSECSGRRKALLVRRGGVRVVVAAASAVLMARNSLEPALRLLQGLIDVDPCMWAAEAAMECCQLITLIPP